jgi:EAL domain-containing protein (putative c-di-GMP-specific phosphodiesterase class I)/GGDEF domain-containing protein
MTLFRQAAIGVVLLTVALFGVSAYSLFRNNAPVVEQQLYDDANRTASALALAIGKAGKGKDVDEAKTAIDTTFQSGLYEAIVYVDNAGNILYGRRVPAAAGDVPGWFASALGLPKSTAAVPVEQARKQIGTLQVEGNRGPMYLRKWEAFEVLLAGFAAVGALFLIVMYFMFTILLRSLEKVRKQAEAVSGNQFIIQEELPHTREFRTVVKAMNALVYKVKGIYKKEAEAVSRLNALLYEDRETHLKNRDFFMMKLKSVLAAEDRFSDGFVVALKLSEPETIKNEQGAPALQKQLMQMSDAARMAANKVEEGVACRVRETDIMLILPALNETETQQLLEEMLFESTVGGHRVDVGAAAYHFGESVSDALSHVDYALMQAASAQDVKPLLYRPERSDVPAWGHNEWRHQLLDAMKLDRFALFYQPIMKRQGGTVQKEVLLRLWVENTLLNAGAFMPVVSHLGLESEVDRYVLGKVAELPHVMEIAVNVSGEFMRQSTTLQWLSSRHEEWHSAGVKLAFEVPNSTVLDNVEAAVSFSNSVQRLGYRFGIDRFVINGGELGYLQKIKPSYIKINAEYLLSLTEAQDESKRSAALFTIVSILDIELIATGVDSKATADRLYDSGIEVLQGFWIGEPHEEQR